MTLNLKNLGGALQQAREWLGSCSWVGEGLPGLSAGSLKISGHQRRPRRLSWVCPGPLGWPLCFEGWSGWEPVLSQEPCSGL